MLSGMSPEFIFLFSSWLGGVLGVPVFPVALHWWFGLVACLKPWFDWPPARAACV